MKEDEPPQTPIMDTGKLLELSNRKSIVFFDGVCGLCNTSVDWILKKDKGALHLFSPLQGSAASLVLSPFELRDLSTVVLLKKGRLYRRSEAISEILIELSGIWRWLGYFLKRVPSPLRNLGYDLVAKKRYAIFGKKEVCRIPTPEERSRFID